MKKKYVIAALVSIAVMVGSSGSQSAEANRPSPPVAGDKDIQKANKKSEKGNAAKPTASPPRDTAPTQEDKQAAADAARSAGNHELALRIYRELADKGVPEALYNLGDMYFAGQGVAKDQTEAVRLFRISADQGYPPAFPILAFINDRSYESAIGALLPLAEKGNSTAQVILAWMHTPGAKRQGNNPEAIKWASAYLDQLQCNKVDFTYASMLADAFSSGQRIAKDKVMAMRIYMKAARCGDYDAEKAIGFLYLDGEGVAKDPEEAKKWFNKAIAHGGPETEESIKKLLRFRGAVASYFAEIERQPKRSIHGWGIGMTKAEVLGSSNLRPVRTNKATTLRGTQEQWVYGNGWAYLYFNENGVLASYQEQDIR